jgi:hypothetical protein
MESNLPSRRFLCMRFWWLPVAVEGAVTRPLPAQIPACGIVAPGSSDSLASAVRHKSWRLGYPPQGGWPC